MYKPKDLVRFKNENLPLTVLRLHDISGLVWIEAADDKGNRTWGTEESFHIYKDKNGRSLQN
jgi:hypothetical protein